LVSQKRRLPSIDSLTPLQQGLLSAVVLTLALLIGSIVYLSFAVSNNWLTPSPRNRFERDLIVAQDNLRAAQQAQSSDPTAQNDLAVADATAQLILVRLDAGQISRAQREGESAFAASPDHAPTAFAYARVLYATKEYEAAQEIVSGLVQDKATLSSELLRETYHLQSQLYQQAGEGPAALAALLDAARISPASAQYYEEAGTLATSLQRYDDAISAYGWALALNRSSSVAQDGLRSLRSSHAGAFERSVEAVSEATGVDIEELLR